MSRTQKNLEDEAERQILQVTIPGSGVVTESGKEPEESADESG